MPNKGSIGSDDQLAEAQQRLDKLFSKNNDNTCVVLQQTSLVTI